MNHIDEVFRKLRGKREKAFIPFITAGDPDLQTTTAAVRELAVSGASLLEIGFPYSDPIADGPVIQASYTRALASGLRLDNILEWTRTLTVLDVPLVAMVSYSLVYHRGPEPFLNDLVQAGYSGAIVPDLPFEEAEALAQRALANEFKLIQLVTPTTPRERAIRIARVSSGFLYCVSVRGITGERDHLPQELSEQLAWLRTQTDLPICVGFGISKPQHIRALRSLADGVIVGSALVKRLENPSRKPAIEVVQEIGALARELAVALHDAQAAH
jgi:tryptophan synthase alpha chain